MRKLLQEQNRRQAESCGDMRARQKALQNAKKESKGTELITTEDAKKFSKEVTDKVIDITKDYEEFEKISTLMYDIHLKNQHIHVENIDMFKLMPGKLILEEKF